MEFYGFPRIAGVRGNGDIAGRNPCPGRLRAMLISLNWMVAEEGLEPPTYGL